MNPDNQSFTDEVSNVLRTDRPSKTPFDLADWNTWHFKLLTRLPQNKYVGFVAFFIPRKKKMVCCISSKTCLATGYMQGVDHIVCKHELQMGALPAGHW